MDYPVNKEVYMSSTSTGRQVKVVMKEVYKHTAACTACRTRKRKCDGKAPCSYCVAKRQPCEFTKQRKRGPPSKHAKVEDNSVVGYSAPKTLSINAANLEHYMSDLIEAKSFIDYYWSYIKHRVPGEATQFILTPHTNADKIQAYATLAFASRISGDATRASNYISQARSLAGTVFDSPQPESIAALVMMSHYWQLVLDIPLARYYYEVAIALSRLTPLTGKLAVFCKVGKILSSNDNAPPKLIATLVKQEVHKSNMVGDFGCPFILAAVDLRAVLGYNVLFPEEKAVKRFFDVIDDVRISEDDRVLIAESINMLKTHGTYAAQTMGDILFFDKMFCSLYLAITEWKSGYPQQALVHAKTCLTGIQQLSAFKQLGIASDFPHICMLGTLCKLFYQQGEPNAVIQVCQFIRDICKIMQPEYNFINSLIDDFLETNINDSPDATYPSSSPSSSAPPTPLCASSTSSPIHNSFSLPSPLSPSDNLNKLQQTYATLPLAPPSYSSPFTFYPQNSTPQNSNIQPSNSQTTNDFHTQDNTNGKLQILNDIQTTFYSPNINNQTTSYSTENFITQATDTAESSVCLVDSILNSTSFNSSFDVSLIDL